MNGKITEACDAALKKYGGDLMLLVAFTELLMSILNVKPETSDSILYSYGLATTSSVIPAFCKQGDIIIADEGAHWEIPKWISKRRIVPIELAKRRRFVFSF